MAPRPARGGSRRGPRVESVHAGLVGERKLIGTRYLADPALRAEYAREIAPRTEVALAKILDELEGERTSTSTAVTPRRAIDLGAGTGAVGRALRARFGEKLPLVEVDIVPAPGRVVGNLAAGLPAGLTAEGRFDLVVAAHLLNELFVDRRPEQRIAARAERVVAWARELLSPEGTIVLLEPALRETSRELLAVRDRLLPSGLEVVAPCFWRGPCPALARERDWCHDAAPAPPGFGSRVDFSYLAVRLAGASRPSEDRALYRIVSDPMPDKGRLRLFGCGAAGRDLLVRLDRHAAPANAPFGAAARGDVLRIEGAEVAGEGLRITPGTSVRSKG